ncbi:MAG: hypothetical protein SFY80_07660 [Verrucomicrobiota bacterium]|nr:hypothetical protein [Verrucomicrobiota bacterium]
MKYITILPLCCLLFVGAPVAQAEAPAAPPAVKKEDKSSVLHIPPIHVPNEIISSLKIIEATKVQLATMRSLPEDELFLYLALNEDYIQEFRYIHFTNQDAKLMIDRSRTEGVPETNREYLMYVEQYEGGLKRMRYLAQRIMTSKEIQLSIEEKALAAVLKRLGVEDPK